MTSLLQGSSAYLAGNIAFKVVGFVMIPFYARYLSVDEYGALNLLELATSLVAITFGLHSLGSSLVRIYHDQKSEAERRATVSTALLGTVVLAAVVVICGTVFAPQIGRAINLPAQSNLLRLAFVAMFSSSLAEMVLVYERIHDRVGFYLLFSLVGLVATLALNIALIGWWHQGIFGFVISKLIVTSLGCAFLLVRVFREVGIVWHGAIARALLRFVGPLVISGLCYFAIHFADRLFLAQVSRAEVGVYSLVYTFAFQLSALIGDGFSKSWGVSFYSYASGEGWQARFVQVARWLVFVLGAGSIGIALFGRDVLVLMVPASYDPPLFMLPVLVLGYFLREIGDFFNSVLLIGSGSGLVGRIAVGGAVLNLVLNAALIPPFGIWGAAWATLGTWAIYCAVCWAGAWRLRGVAMQPWPLGTLLLICAGCLLAQLGWAKVGPVTGLLLDTVAFGGFLLFAGVLYLSRAEREDAWLFARRTWAKLPVTRTARKRAVPE